MTLFETLKQALLSSWREENRKQKGNYEYIVCQNSKWKAVLFQHTVQKEFYCLTMFSHLGVNDAFEVEGELTDDEIDLQSILKEESGNCWVYSGSQEINDVYSISPQKVIIDFLS
jgi:hypothetical protein